MEGPETEARDQVPQAVLRLALPAALGFGLLLRLVHWERTAVLFNDGPVFLALARAVESGALGTALAHPFHPLYPTSIALVHALGAPFGLGWERAGILAAALAGTAAIGALYAFVRGAFGVREAALAACLLAFHADAIETSGDMQSEGLYLALFLAACACLWPALRDGDGRRAGWAGAFAGLAYLTRPEGLGVAVVGLGLATLRVLLRQWRPATGARVVAGLLVGASLFVVPYVAALYAETGELWLTRKKSVSWVAGIDGPPAHFSGEHSVEPDWEAIAIESGMERPNAGAAEREREPGGAEASAPTPDDSGPSLVARLLAASWDLFRSAHRSFRYEMFALLLPGLWAVRGRPGLRAALVGSVLAAYGALLFLLALNVGYVSQRHTLAPVSLLLGYAACGVAPWARGVGRVLGRPVPWLAMAAAGVALAASVGTARTLRVHRADEIAERRAAEWLRERTSEPGVIATRKRRVAYYADASFVQLREKTPARMLHYLDSYDVSWVIVNADDVGEYGGVGPLMPRFLEPVHREEAEGETALVLRYRSPRAEAAEGP